MGRRGVRPGLGSLAQTRTSGSTQGSNGENRNEMKQNKLRKAHRPTHNAHEVYQRLHRKTVAGMDEPRSYQRQKASLNAWGTSITTEIKQKPQTSRRVKPSMRRINAAPRRTKDNMVSSGAEFPIARLLKIGISHSDCGRG
jgi:hypothetical protein